MRKLAGKAGVDPSTVSQLEAGKRIGRSDTVARIAAALGLDPSLTQGVVSGDQEVVLPKPQSAEELLEQALAAIKRERETKRPEVIMVPVVEGFAAAGEGAITELDYVPYIPRPSELGHDFAGIDVKGDCLAPRLRDGERVILDRNATPYEGCIVAAQHEGETILRVLQGDRLISYNGHEPIPLTDDVLIMGVVVWSGRRP